MVKMKSFALLVALMQLLTVHGREIPSDLRAVANTSIPEDMFLTIPELIRYYGYPIEEHEALTDDGYYLKLHRIPHGRSNKSKVTADGKNKTKPVIFLQHGLLLDSSIFVSNLPHQSLAYLLADAGYDVWMGNNRGNTISRKHMFHSINSTKFWDFCWDDMAKYDLPAMIDYVLQNTHQTQLYYVGYSQGTMIAFGGFSENAGLQKKIKKFFALGPVNRLAHVTRYMRVLAFVEPIIREFIEKYNVHEFLPHNQFSEFLAEIVCPLEPHLCMEAMLWLYGGEAKNFNITRIPFYLMHNPAGTSVKNLYHYAQSVSKKDFKKYDYGWWGNLIWYGSIHAPSYDLRKVVVPTVLFSGTIDPLAAPLDVEWTASQLPNVEHFVIDGYGHADFGLAVNAKEKVYDKLISMAN